MSTTPTTPPAAPGTASPTTVPAAAATNTAAPAVPKASLGPVIKSFAGHHGTPFMVEGLNFGHRVPGSSILPGRVEIGGRSIDVTAWRDTSIKGFVPKDVTGEVVLKVVTVHGSSELKVKV